jgi:hypothetical protein
MPIEVPKAQRSGSGKENRVAVYLVFMTPVHHRSGIPMPTFSCLSDEFARNAQAHTKFLSFWCGHDGSFSKGQAEPVFSFDVHLIAFDGRRGNANENSCHLVLEWRSRITPMIRETDYGQGARDAARQFYCQKLRSRCICQRYLRAGARDDAVMIFNRL